MRKKIHRPKRKYPKAPLHRCEVPVKDCPFCGEKLRGSGKREVNKYVQTLNGAVRVLGYKLTCKNKECSHPETYYGSTSAEKLSLPYQTYGLDVMAYIASERQGKQRQFKEIWRDLIGYGLEISERAVGMLHERIEALYMGSQVLIEEQLFQTIKEYGRLMFSVDALKPDGTGGTLYVLYELLGGTVISVAMIEQATEENLTAWLSTYEKWSDWVEGTLSDKEAALVLALKSVFTQAKHQLCQMHFVKQVSEPVHKADRGLQKAIRDEMGPVPSVPQIKAEEKSEEVEKKSEPDENVSQVGRLSPSIASAIDIISGIDLKDLDILSAQEWKEWLATDEPEQSVSEKVGVSVAIEQSEGTTEAARDVERIVVEKETSTEKPPFNSASICTTVINSPLDKVDDKADERDLELQRVNNNINSLPTIDLTEPEKSTLVDTYATVPELPFLSAEESVTQVKQSLLAQIPASVRVLAEPPTCEEDVTYWEHSWYRRAIMDTRHQGSRKPFRCGGLRGFQQLETIANHLAIRQAEQGLDPYLTKLLQQAQRTVEKTRSLADDITRSRDWLILMERLLDNSPPTTDDQPASATQKKRMEALLKECCAQKEAGPTLKALQLNWKQTHQRWADDLYHHLDIEGLPRSNLGIEALFGEARRKQRRVSGQANTSPLTVTGQPFLRNTSTQQAALLEQFQQVPTWIYRIARNCVEAMQDSVRWPRQLHRDTANALLKLDATVLNLRQLAADSNT